MKLQGKPSLLRRDHGSLVFLLFSKGYHNFQCIYLNRRQYTKHEETGEEYGWSLWKGEIVRRVVMVIKEDRIGIEC